MDEHSISEISRSRGVLYPDTLHRVSLGFRDLTRIPCGIRKSEKFLGGIRDLTATWEVGFDKILARVANLERKWKSVQR